MSRTLAQQYALRKNKYSKENQKHLTSFIAKALIFFSVLAFALSYFYGLENSVMVLMFLGLFLAAVGYFLPPIGLIGIGYLSTLDAISQSLVLTGGLLRYNTLNYVLIAVIMISLPTILKYNDLSTRLLEIFLLLLGLQLIISPDIPRGIQDILNIVSMFGLVVYIARSINDPEAFYWMGIVNGFLAGVGSAIIYLQVDQLPYLNPNVWTFFPMTALFSLCIAFPIAIKKQKGIILILSLATINFFWVFLSGSRGNLLISLCCIVYLFVATQKSSLRLVMILLVVVGILGMLPLFADQSSAIMERLLLTFDTTRSLDVRTSHRSVIARAGLLIFMENPLGVGTGGFSQSVANLNLLSGYGRPAHAAWIKVLAENGFIGALLLFSFVISFAWIGWEKRKQTGLLAFGLLVSASFIVGFISKEYQGKSMWLLSAAAIVLMNTKNAIIEPVPEYDNSPSSNFSRRLKAKRSIREP
jgi:hypothetical protein